MRGRTEQTAGMVGGRRERVEVEIGGAEQIEGDREKERDGHEKEIA